MYKDQICSIEILKESSAILWKLHGLVTNDEFINSVFLGVKYLKKIQDSTNISSLILDMSGFVPNGIKDMDWMQEEVLSILFVNNDGLKNIALVSSQSQERFLSLQHSLQEGQCLNIYQEPKNALQWISELNLINVDSAAS